jgi:hypothetical protein
MSGPHLVLHREIMARRNVESWLTAFWHNVL